MKDTSTLRDESLVNDMEVQVEEEETLIIQLKGYKPYRSKIRPQSCSQEIKATYSNGNLIVAIPKQKI
ncbi:hypothetical protein KP509_11G012700 [Ceratopteris richardii]|uniref:SHSP domain-containing protein n=2 Tax=Ceratopteris richardii TaxID=49495 RepID=A0A8T2TSW8_CERRI|nr:hypothetical protein KP509_11G012700 [Ceratopteris richardii]